MALHPSVQVLASVDTRSDERKSYYAVEWFDVDVDRTWEFAVYESAGNRDAHANALAEDDRTIAVYELLAEWCSDLDMAEDFARENRQIRA